MDKIQKPVKKLDLWFYLIQAICLLLYYKQFSEISS